MPTLRSCGSLLSGHRLHRATWPGPVVPLSPDERRARDLLRLPTLLRRDYRGSTNRYRSGEVVHDVSGVVGGVVSPTSAEELMGFPEGWTDERVRIRMPHPKGDAIRVVSICSGVGGLDLGAYPAARDLDVALRTEVLVDHDAWVRAHLIGRWNRARVFGDLRSQATSDALKEHRSVELLLTGPPCTPRSTAGRRRRDLPGEEHEEYLLPQVLEAVGVVAPKAIVFENVPPLARSRDFPLLLTTLRDLDYDCSWRFVSADDLGAWHQRARFFLLAWRRDLVPRTFAPHGLAALPALPTWQERPALARCDAAPGSYALAEARERVAALGGAVCPPVARAVVREAILVLLRGPGAPVRGGEPIFDHPGSDRATPCVPPSAPTPRSAEVTDGRPRDP